MYYLFTGSSLDWAKATLGVKYSYVLELGPDEEEFELKQSEIKPVACETYAGIKAFLQSIC
jgi:hypothetical protein